MGKKRVRLEEPTPAPTPVKKAKRVRLESMVTTGPVYVSHVSRVKPGQKPRDCKKCGHTYYFPCDGKEKTCMNTVAGNAAPPPKKRRVRA